MSLKKRVAKQMFTGTHYMISNNANTTYENIKSSINDTIKNLKEQVEELNKKIKNFESGGSEALAEIKKSNLVRVSVPNSNGKCIATVFITAEENNVNTIKNLKEENFAEDNDDKMIKASLVKNVIPHIKKNTPVAKALRPIVWEE